jgi:thymidylate kinase
MLRNGQAKLYPNMFQFVQFLNKFVFQWTYLLWLRLTCDVVIMDRWSLSAIVYGDATGVNWTLNRILYWLLVKPDVTVVLHGSSFKRKTVDDVYEKDSALQLTVRKGYYDWVQENPDDHELIDNQGTKDEVHERILSAIEAV